MLSRNASFFTPGLIVELALIGQQEPTLACIIEADAGGLLVYRGAPDHRQYFPWHVVLAVTESRALTLQAARAHRFDAAPAPLFQRGVFAQPDGALTGYQINLDRLTPADFDTLAVLLTERLPPYSAVECATPAGYCLAAALRARQRPDASLTLIVDDAYKGGSALEKQRGDRAALGAVVFAYEPVMHPWVVALFQLTARP